jgi:hypothetical protein
MRNWFLACLLALASVSVALADEAPAERVAKALSSADPLSDGSASAGLFAADAATEDAIRAVAKNTAAAADVRDRALRVILALDLAKRVRDGESEPGVAYWLALDEIDQRYPAVQRESLLGRALPDAAKRKARLDELVAARATAAKFCSEWNETYAPGSDEEKRYAALEAELKKVGAAAVPTLAEILAIPPQATFGVVEPHPGVSGRRQVRAIFGLLYLDAKDAAPYLVWQCRGPSYTESTNAQALVGKWFVPAANAGGEESKRVETIEAWWKKNRAEHAVVLDHLVRTALRWTRDGVADKNPAVAEGADFTARKLAELLGVNIAFPEDGDVAAKRARVVEIDRLWIAGALR